MEKIFILFSFYFFIIFSIIGYGNISSLIFKRTYSIGEQGLNGILLLILISYLTNFFSPHSIIHNLIIIIIGLIAFALSIFQNWRKKIKELKIMFFIFLILFIGLLMYKNHDDFFYYHFSYTLSIINYKKILGLGLLNHGFRTPSSIFYFNSLFYLPHIKYFLMNSGAVFIMGFCNIVFLSKINNLLKHKKNTFILFLLILSFIYVNTAFYRLAEHGTDRSALILIFLLVITYLESLNILNNPFNKKNFIEYYEKIIVLLLLIVSLKSFYLIYLSLFLLWFYQFRLLLFDKNSITMLIKNKFTYLFILGLSLFILQVFLNTGCLVYPASFTCFDSLQWAIPVDQVKQMQSWYELWSKSGASPNFRVENPEIYLTNFNWLARWIDSYFFTKVTDTLLVIFLISLICVFLFINKKNKLIHNNNYKLLYLFLILFFFEWFINHPALRYGGYTLLALIFFLPLSIFLERVTLFNSKFKKKIFILILITFSVFIFKNLIRLNKENIQYQYNVLINPYFYIAPGAYEFDKIIAKIDSKQKKTNDNLYLILNYSLLKNDN